MEEDDLPNIATFEFPEDPPDPPDPEVDEVQPAELKSVDPESGKSKIKNYVVHLQNLNFRKKEV